MADSASLDNMVQSSIVNLFTAKLTEDHLYKNADNLGKEKLFSLCVWQCLMPNVWAFGLSVRGFVRKPHYVSMALVPPKFVNHVPTVGWTVRPGRTLTNPTDTETSVNGESATVDEAVNEAEAALKEAWKI